VELAMLNQDPWVIFFSAETCATNERINFINFITVFIFYKEFRATERERL
jgi:hypothetical protein